MELQKELTLTANLLLPATLIFDYPTIAEMSDFISASLPVEEPESSRSLTLQQAAEGSPMTTVQDPLITMTTAERKEYVESQVRSKSTFRHELLSNLHSISDK